MPQNEREALVARAEVAEARLADSGAEIERLRLELETERAKVLRLAGEREALAQLRALWRRWGRAVAAAVDLAEARRRWWRQPGPVVLPVEPEAFTGELLAAPAK